MSGLLIFYLVPPLENNFIIYFLMPHYAKCDVLSGQKKIQTEISLQQNVGAQKYKKTCITVLKVISHNAIKIFIS